MKPTGLTVAKIRKAMRLFRKNDNPPGAVLFLHKPRKQTLAMLKKLIK